MFLLLGIVFLSCQYEYNCGDLAIYPTFLGFDSSDIDTIIIRKFEPNTNYQNLIDTFIATSANSLYSGVSDSTTVFIDYNRQEKDIKVNYDWQIFVPAKQRVISISDIKSEKTTGERDRFGEPIGNSCYNRIFSMNVNGQLINLTNLPPYVVYINN